MNQEQIIAMAVNAGIIPWTKHEYVGGKNFSASDEGLDGDLASLIQFAKLVAEHSANVEREACAKVAKTISDKYGWGHYGNEVDTADEIAAAIRARGQA